MSSHFMRATAAILVAAKIATGCVARLAHILNMSCSMRLATDDFGHNASHEVTAHRP
jgi:hypothetical protein